MPSLEIVHLDLGQNRISEAGFIDIFKALEDNHSLISLNLGNFEAKNRNKIGILGSQMLK